MIYINIALVNSRSSLIFTNYLLMYLRICLLGYLPLQLQHNPQLKDAKVIKAGPSLELMEGVESFEKLTEKIKELTDQVAGKNNAILDKPIYVSVEASDCPELTLIDLPGIAKNPLKGSEQPENIEDITKGLIETYIKVCIYYLSLPRSTSPSLSPVAYLFVSLHINEYIYQLGIRNYYTCSNCC